MGQLEQVTTQKRRLPPRIVIHGTGGVGKTTMMAKVPGIVVLPAEEGEGILEYPTFPKPQSYADVMGALGELATGDHPYKALGIDTIDHIEPLVWAAVCADRSGKQVYENIEDFGYAKGYIYADPYWIEFFQALDALRRRGMLVMALCHNRRKTVQDPMVGPHDRFEPKLHDRAVSLLYEWADVVGFLDIERTQVEIEGSSGRKTLTAAATGQRRLHLEDRGSFRAKNRYDLPPVIEIPKENPYGPLRDEIAKSMGLAKKEAA